MSVGVAMSLVGVRPFKEALKSHRNNLRAELRAKVRKAGNVVRNAMRLEITAQGLVDSGRLRRSIRVNVKTGVGFAQARVGPRGKYVAIGTVHERGGWVFRQTSESGGGDLGRWPRRPHAALYRQRSWARPAVATSRPRVMAMLGELATIELPKQSAAGRDRQARRIATVRRQFRSIRGRG